MKKYIIFIIVSSLFVSCSDMLDLQTDGRITMDDVFTDRNGVMGYLNSCYGYCPAPYMDRASFTDEAQDADDVTANSRYGVWYADGITAQSFVRYSVDGSPWTDLYVGIRKCNVFLQNIKNVTSNTILASDNEIAGWTAQAYTLRALYYLQLIKRYGDVPILTETYGTTHDYTLDKRSKFSEVVKQIIEDCDAALSTPNTSDGFPWSISDNQNGIMHRAIPYAIKSQAITYAASSYWSDGSYTWADATEINKEALYQCLTNDYKLFDVIPAPDIAQNPYALYFITNSNDKRAVDKETIYGRGSQMEVWKYAGMPSNSGMIKSGPCPTQELVDCYEMASTGEAPITGYSDEQHLNPIVNMASGYNPNDPYIGRDPRFYASIYYNGAARALSSVADRDDHYPLGFSSNANNISVVDQGTYNDVTTIGGDPWVQTTTLSEDLNNPPSVTLTFEYKSTTTIPDAQFFFCNPNPAGGVSTDANIAINAASSWTKFTLDIGYAVSQFNWGKTGHSLRFDVGSTAGHTLQIRNMKINVVSASAGETVETFVGGTDGITAADSRTTRTGYYLRKYNNWKSNVANNADGAVRLFRLAELYLNFAESAYQSQGPDAAITLGGSMTMSARDAVNAVRKRAGMPDFPIGMSVSDFEKKYRNERRVELAFEEHRYFDVRRWNILEKTDKYVTGMRITNSGTSYIYNRIGFSRKCWVNKYLLYAIDQNEVNKMDDYTGTTWQNPGWN